MVSSQNKAFWRECAVYSIFGSCLDGTDDYVRLDNYMEDERAGAGGWKIERCYMKCNEYIRLLQSELERNKGDDSFIIRGK